ncbi:MAG TPA: OB-fold nucleic acid binding domain-containing protein [Candidatus Rubrimentiphilum sp.]|nr:OB-fold nucleic acid binding domain-containing protein [Candidatus Rubrimentiphilum sp.]
MIHAFTCLLFPLFAGCGPFIDYPATASEIMRNPAYYSGHSVAVTGRVHAMRQFLGISMGTPAETFLLCDGTCVQVFMREHTPIREGDRVSVRGKFLTLRHIGRMTLRNGIEAGEIFPRS